MERLGKVQNAYSNSLVVIAVDAAHAAAWQGPDEDGGGDFERAMAAMGQGGSLSLGQGSGLVFEIGGCGTAGVFRVDSTTLTAVEHYSNDWSDEIEVDFFRCIRDTPTAPSVVRVGSFEIASGILALVAIVEPVEGIGEEALAAARSRGKDQAKWGLLVSIAAGTYEIHTETFAPPLTGAWGIIPRRIRIVPVGSAVAI